MSSRLGARTPPAPPTRSPARRRSQWAEPPPERRSSRYRGAMTVHPRGRRCVVAAVALATLLVSPWPSDARPADRVLHGHAGHQHLVGSRHGDLLVAGPGRDEIDGEGGSDKLNGGSGNDVLVGGTGDDRVMSGTGNDSGDGGPGRDVVIGLAGNDVLAGGGDTDHVSGGTGNDAISGGPGNDEMDGGDGNDVIDAGDGNDRITGDRGDDLIYPGPGADTVYAEEGTANHVVATDDGVRDDIWCVRGNMIGREWGLVTYVGRRDPLDALRGCRVEVVAG
jgi:Ca2+-binding RTX toxin-like protein